jgi:hypothetical protein
MFARVLIHSVVLLLAVVGFGGLQCLSAVAGVNDATFFGPDEASLASTFVPPDDLAHPPTKAWTYHDMAVLQAKAGNWSGALKTVSQIRDSSPIRQQWKKAWTYRSIAVIQAKAGNVSGAMKTVSQIRVTNPKPRGPSTLTSQIQAWAYRDIAAIQTAAGDVSGAMKTVSQIRDRPCDD